MTVIYHNQKDHQDQPDQIRQQPKRRHGYKPMRPLASFAEAPNNIRFETQDKEETIELFLRQHPIVTLPAVIMSVLLVISPLILFPFISLLVPFADRIPIQYAVVGTLFWYLATFGFILVSFINWFFNIYIVTNERIVDIDFMYLLYKHFAVVELDNIEDISYQAGGFWAALFNYGTVRVQTAGEYQNIEFDRVQYPEKIVGRIRDLMQDHKAGRTKV